MSRAKDFHRCLRNLHRFTAGQVTVVDWDTDTFSELLIDVSPNGGLYNGGQFRFQIELENSVPTVTCLTNIYHPNIDPTERYENVCLNILNDWPPSYGLQDCIQGILFLLHNPNLDDPLSPYFDDFYDEQEFAKNVRSSLLGEEVEGVTFDTRRSPTATGTMTSTEPELEDTLDLGNFFSDQKQEDTFGLKHLFAEQKQVCVEDVSAEDTAVGVENVFVDRKQEDSFDLGNALGDQNQEDSVGVENICADRKQETTAGLGNNFADDETVVDLAGSATVVNHTPEACGDLIKDPSSRVMLHRPHEKGARLILACKHSCQTVIPVLRKLYKLLNVAAICVRYSLSHTHRQPAERSTCYE